MGVYLPGARTLGYVVWPGAGMLLPWYPSQFLSIIVNVELTFPLPPFGATLGLSPFPHLHFSTPPTSLDECGFFNSLVVGLPYS